MTSSGDQKKGKGGIRVAERAKEDEGSNGGVGFFDAKREGDKEGRKM